MKDVGLVATGSNLDHENVASCCSRSVLVKRDGCSSGGVVLVDITVVEEVEVGGFGGRRVGITVGARCTGFICFGSEVKSKSGRMYLSCVRSGCTLVMMRSSNDKWLRANHVGYADGFLPAEKQLGSFSQMGYGIEGLVLVSM